MMIGGGVMATVGIVLDFRGFIKIRQSGKKLKNPERIKRRSMSPYTER